VRLYFYARAEERTAEADALVGRYVAACMTAFGFLRQIAIACTVTAYSELSLSNRQRFDAERLQIALSLSQYGL